MCSQLSTSLVLYLAICGFSASRVAQAREGPGYRAWLPFPVRFSAVAAAEEHADGPTLTAVISTLAEQLDAKTAAWLAGARDAAIPAPAVQLGSRAAPEGGGTAAAGGRAPGGGVHADDNAELTGAPGPGAPQAGGWLDWEPTPFSAWTSAHDATIITARLEPQIRRLEGQYPGIQICLDYRSWPPTVEVDGRPWVAVQDALDSAGVARYSTTAGEAASGPHEHQLRFAVSRGERGLLGLEYIDAGELLADLHDSYGVSITVRPSVMVLEGSENATEAAAAQLRRTIAASRSSMGLDQPTPAWLTAGRAFGWTCRTIGVPPLAADFLTSAAAGAQALRSAKHQLAPRGVCLGYSPAPSGRKGWMQRFLHTTAAASAGIYSRMSATMPACGGKDVDWAEDYIRRWLVQGTPEEMDTVQPFAQDGSSAVQGLDMARVPLLSGSARDHHDEDMPPCWEQLHAVL